MTRHCKYDDEPMEKFQQKEGNITLVIYECPECGNEEVEEKE